jgi:hypothetical protein
MPFVNIKVAGSCRRFYWDTNLQSQLCQFLVDPPRDGGSNRAGEIAIALQGATECGTVTRAVRDLYDWTPTGKFE